MLNQFEMKGFITALGIGLLIGIVRERMSKLKDTTAGIRTHALISILSASTWVLGLPVFLFSLLALGTLTVFSYRATLKRDPGLTGEISSLLTFALSAMAMEKTAIAASLGVLCAILIQAKDSIHKITREILTENEVNDGLLLLASVLIILPILPSYTIDPWNIINPGKIWKIVLLIMISGMLGHVFKRLLGQRFGSPLAGFFSGLISSTAATIHFGEKVKDDPKYLYLASGSALLANLSSFLLLSAVAYTTSPNFLKHIFFGFLIGIITLIFISGVYLKKSFFLNHFSNTNPTRAFKLTHAISIALLITLVSGVTGVINTYWGGSGVILASSLVAIGEIHSATVGLAQVITKDSNPNYTQLGFLFILISSGLSKVTLAYMTGGKKYALLVGQGLGVMILSYLMVFIF